MKNKGATEMTVGTLTTIVFLLAIFIFGLVLVKVIFFEEPIQETKVVCENVLYEEIEIDYITGFAHGKVEDFIIKNKTLNDEYWRNICENFLEEKHYELLNQSEDIYLEVFYPEYKIVNGDFPELTCDYEIRWIDWDNENSGWKYFKTIKEGRVWLDNEHKENNLSYYIGKKGIPEFNNSKVMIDSKPYEDLTYFLNHNDYYSVIIEVRYEEPTEICRKVKA